MDGERSSASNSVWLSVLNSSSVTALITTLIGGLFASFVTFLYQEKAKEVDRVRAETADYLERERKVVEDAFNITGRLIAASENMIQLTSDTFDERHRTPAQLTSLRTKKQEIISNYNEADREWRAQQAILRLRIRMEHGADPSVSDAWDKASLALSDFSDCSRLWFETHVEAADQSNLAMACATRRKALNDNLEVLTREILRLRQIPSTTPK